MYVVRSLFDLLPLADRLLVPGAALHLLYARPFCPWLFDQYADTPFASPLFIRTDDFIVNKYRGKSGPMFSFDVHDDVRLIHDASVEKDEVRSLSLCHTLLCCLASRADQSAIRHRRTRAKSSNEVGTIGPSTSFPRRGGRCSTLTCRGPSIPCTEIEILSRARESDSYS